MGGGLGGAGGLSAGLRPLRSLYRRVSYRLATENLEKNLPPREDILGVLPPGRGVSGAPLLDLYRRIEEN